MSPARGSPIRFLALAAAIALIVPLASISFHRPAARPAVAQEGWNLAGAPDGTRPDTRVAGAPGGSFTLPSDGAGDPPAPVDGGTATATPAANTIVFVAPTAASTPAPPVAPPAPAAAAQTTAGSVTVVARGFGQSRAGAPITVGMLFRNDGGPVDKVPVGVTVYDAGGAVIAAGDTTLNYLASGQTTGLAHRLKPKGTGLAARVEVDTGGGDPAGQAQPGALSFSQASLSSGRSGLQASAVLSSSYADDLSAVHVSALLFDASGAIVGGGTTTKRLVPAGGSTGVVVAVDASGTPASVSFYAQLP